MLFICIFDPGLKSLSAHVLLVHVILTYPLHYLSRDLSAAERNTDNDSIPRDRYSLIVISQYSNFRPRWPRPTCNSTRLVIQFLPCRDTCSSFHLITQNTHTERRDGFYSTDVTSSSKYIQQTRSERYDIH
jgi:hypothetical protein